MLKTLGLKRTLSISLTLFSTWNTGVQNLSNLSKEIRLSYQHRMPFQGVHFVSGKTYLLHPKCHIIGEKCTDLNDCWFCSQLDANGELLIRNAQLKHAGRYTCTAQTIVDNSSASADLVVRGKSFSILKLQSQKYSTCINMYNFLVSLAQILIYLVSWFLKIASHPCLRMIYARQVVNNTDFVCLTNYMSSRNLHHIPPTKCLCL